MCQSSDASANYCLTDYKIALCGGCGFEYQPNFAGGGESGEMFSERYFCVQHREAFVHQCQDYALDPSAKIYNRWLERLEATVSPGAILDVGCAFGTFLAIARERGWTARGVEISQFAAQFAREHRDLTVFNGDLQAFEGADESFDVLTFWDSIEHVADPGENLRRACRLLRRGGLMLLTTDNFDCLIAELARLAYRVSLGAIRYPMQRVFIDRNRSYFTESSLRAAIDSLGLNVIEFEKMDYPLDKIQTTRLERLGLRTMYKVGELTHRQSQVTVVAQKE